MTGITVNFQLINKTIYLLFIMDVKIIYLEKQKIEVILLRWWRVTDRGLAAVALSHKTAFISV